MQPKEYIANSMICAGSTKINRCFMVLGEGKSDFITLSDVPDFSEDISILKSESNGDYAIVARSTEKFGKMRCTVDDGSKMHCEQFHYVLHEQSPRQSPRAARTASTLRAIKKRNGYCDGMEDKNGKCRPAL